MFLINSCLTSIRHQDYLCAYRLATLLHQEENDYERCGTSRQEVVTALQHAMKWYSDNYPLQEVDSRLQNLAAYGYTDLELGFSPERRGAISLSAGIDDDQTLSISLTNPARCYYKLAVLARRIDRGHTAFAEVGLAPVQLQVRYDAVMAVIFARAKDNYDDEYMMVIYMETNLETEQKVPLVVPITADRSGLSSESYERVVAKAALLSTLDAELS